MILEWFRKFGDFDEMSLVQSIIWIVAMFCVGAFISLTFLHQ